MDVVQGGGRGGGHVQNGRTVGDDDGEDGEEETGKQTRGHSIHQITTKGSIR